MVDRRRFGLKGQGQEEFNALLGQPGQGRRSDRTIRLWDVATWQCQRVIDGHTAVVTAVIFLPTLTPGSRYPILASSSLDETIRLWNVETGECLDVLRPDRLYEAMNITGVTGLSPNEIAILKSLGAV
ncbi:MULTISPECIES: hypothetical protein [Cyanophyceae]|uniref:hypothetical protein n=1 Tax=Cyanophyceae TaxID=3028117 RepID=UPI0018EF7CD1|nr:MULTISPECIES: hypothetical protein [unclassified Phormidium]